MINYLSVHGTEVVVHIVPHLAVILLQILHLLIGLHNVHGATLELDGEGTGR